MKALAVLFLITGLASLPARAADRPPAPDRWALTVTGGIGTDNGIENVLTFQPDLNDTYVAAVALGREVARWRDLLALEVEGQVAQHFVHQRLTEGNLYLAARWLKFPWNDTVRTSFAVGDGLSYTSSIPLIERERAGGEPTTRLLHFIVLELELAPPDEEHWSAVARLHHRSGMFGVFDGVTTGSNLLFLGIKHRF